MYNSLVERCFKDCVDSFRRKDLDAAEEKARRRSASPPLGASRAAARCSPPRSFGKHHLHLTSTSPPPSSSLYRHPQCVQRCCEKFMKHSARVGLRFGELSAAAESQMQAQLQQMQGGAK